MARKRKAGARTPSGQLSRAKEVPFVPLHLVREQIRLGKLDPRWGTPYGRMALGGRLKQGHLDAAAKFVDVRRAADTALGIPPRTCQAQAMGELRGHEGDVETDEEKRRKARDLDAWDKVVMILGVQSDWMRAMERVVLYEREPDDEAQRIALKQALVRLCMFWGIRLPDD